MTDILTRIDGLKKKLGTIENIGTEAELSGIKLMAEYWLETEIERSKCLETALVAEKITKQKKDKITEYEKGWMDHVRKTLDKTNKLIIHLKEEIKRCS